MRSLVGLFLVSLTLALLAVGGVTLRSAVKVANESSSMTRSAEERAFTARVLTLKAGRIAPELVAFGEVRSSRELELRAGAAGRIVELGDDFADGARVAAGELLVRIDPADAQSALDLAQTGLSEAEAELRDATRSLEIARDDLDAAEAQAELRSGALARQQGIADRGLGTASELEAAELAMSNAIQGTLSRRQALAEAEARTERAETGIERQRLALAEARRRLGDTELRAKFTGVLSNVTAVAGGLVSVNEKLGELIDPDALEVAFRVSTVQYARLIDGRGDLEKLEIVASLDGRQGEGLTATGRLARVDAAVGEGMSGRLIFAKLDAAPGFRPGDFVTVSITEPELDGVALVPGRAVGADGTVLVLDAENRLKSYPVTVLRRQGDDAIIKVGALDGRDIVAQRSNLVGEGILVRPIRGDLAGRLPEAEGKSAALIDLSPERRAELIAFVEENADMSEATKAQVLAQLREGRVPAEIVSRIEARMGG